MMRKCESEIEVVIFFAVDLRSRSNVNMYHKRLAVNGNANKVHLWPCICAESHHKHAHAVRLLADPEAV